MARTQGDATPTALDDFKVRAELTEDPLLLLAKRANAIWGGWQPTITALHCADSASHVYYAETAAAYTSAYAVRVPTQEGRAGFGLRARFRTTATPGVDTAVIQCKALAGASASEISALAAGSTSWGWQVLAAAVVADLTGTHEIIDVSIKAPAAVGSNVELRALSLYRSPYSGALAAGVQTDGAIALDVDQWDADTPLTPGALRDLADMHEACHLKFLWPIATIADSLRAAETKFRYISGTASDWVTVAGPYQLDPLPVDDGQVATVAYSALVWGTGGAQIVIKAAPDVDAADLATAEAITPYNAAYGGGDHAVAGNWVDGTFTVPQTQTCWLFVQAKGNGAAAKTTILSLSLWAAARS